jgi:aryl-alcohol dehydrogenase-like predicted oxidoreductase
VDVVLSYCHNTLNDTSLVDLLPYLHSKGVGVISASVTSMGLFTRQVLIALQHRVASRPQTPVCMQWTCTTTPGFFPSQITHQ